MATAEAGASLGKVAVSGVVGLPDLEIERRPPHRPAAFRIGSR
jgi:hypothetical protein